MLGTFRSICQSSPCRLPACALCCLGDWAMGAAVKYGTVIPRKPCAVTAGACTWIAAATDSPFCFDHGVLALFEWWIVCTHILFVRVFSMEALRNGALLHVSKVLSSKNLSVKIVACGLISHLLDMFDYGWGADMVVLENIMRLLQQFDDGIAVVGASTIFTLVRRGETFCCAEVPHCDNALTHWFLNSSSNQRYELRCSPLALLLFP